MAFSKIHSCCSSSIIRYNFWQYFKDAGFVHQSFQNKTNQVIWDFCFHETNPQNKSFKSRSSKRIHKTNLSKTGLRNESTKWIFWNQYGFANPKPRIPMDSGLFKVRLCTKDSSGFLRIRWIRENRSNLLKISLQNESFENIKDSWSTIQNESRFVL
jgi:hypothetical protein